MGYYGPKREDLTMLQTMRKPKLYTLNECSYFSGSAPATWRRWIFDGRVDVVHLGRSVRVTEAELDRVLREGPRPMKKLVEA
jgi:hypothetical protein